MSESEKRETHAAVIAEMRRGTKLPGYWRSCDVNEILQYHADRLEAAHERELLTKSPENVNSGAASDSRDNSGDAAKLREALREAIGETCLRCTKDCGDCLNLKAGWMAKAKAALSAPPRNCDVGTADEQQARHYAWCHKYGIDGDNEVNCAHPDMSCDLCCLRWAQMPYEAEAQKGGEE